MRRTSFADAPCSIAQALEVIGDWWTPLILRDVLMGVTRFEQMQSRLGIARNVLAQRLDSLVEHGVLEQVQYQDRPVRHEYVLTRKGKDLWPVLTMLRQWGDTWYAPDGPPIEMVHTPCGHAAPAELSCSACGETLRGRDLELRHGPGAKDGGLLPA
ncbi:MAG: transcriptional regulator [Actinomycetales bacterium]|nr:MAG: transcriptional regulator [Actinomycetales bacterium]